MLAHVTVAGCTDEGASSVHHFRVEAAEAPTGRMLAEALRDRGLRYALYAGALPLDELPSLDSDAPLLLTPFPRSREETHRPPSLWLVTRTGPDSGRAAPLSRGVYRIGRGTGDFPVLDPAISREGATLDVSLSGIVLTSGHGAESPVRLGQGFQLGATDLSVLAPPEPRGPSSGVWPPPAEELGEGAGKSRPWLMLTTAAAPVAIAVVLAVALGSWYFLAFSALGLLTGGIPAVAEIRRRRRLRTSLESAATRRVEDLEVACPPLGDLVLGVLAARRPTHRVVPGAESPSGLSQATPLRSVGERPAHPLPVRLGTGPVAPVVRFREGREPRALPTAPGPVVLELAPGSCGALPAAVGNAVVVRLLDLAARGDVALGVSPGCALPVELEFVPGVQCGRPSADAAVPGGAVPGRAVPGVWLVPESEHAAAAAAVADWSPGSSRAGGTAPPAVVVYDGVARPNDTWRLGAWPPGTPASADPSARGTRFAGPRTPGPTGSRSQEHWLELDGERHRLRLDGAHATTVRRFAAALAHSSPRGSRSATLPDSALWYPSESRWAASSISALRFALGQDAAGALDVDLVTDGPHLLVAGTTGSGKSELLRTIIASLIHRYAPDELALVLVDFKGGATLGAFAGEPHAHGLVTDLNEESAARFLRSLRHELRRRERILGRLGVPGYSAARTTTSGPPRAEDFLPRLLVVVDEFRVLADEIPDALPELLRIAAVGRSLGVHLVLATQRPQGVVTAEMRANINTTVCLRVLGDFDAQDLVGTTGPARLPGDRPGRGFLRRSGQDASEFQAARLSDGVLDWTLTELGSTIGAAGASSAHRGTRPCPQDSIGEPQPGTERTVPPLFSPELPLRLDPADLRRDGDGVPIALLDDIAHLRHRPLNWSAGMRRLAVVGGPQSGAQPMLGHLIDQSARLRAEHHAYVLDGSGTMTQGLEDLPRVSGWASATDPQRLAEVLDVLDEARFAAPTLIVVLSLAGWSSALAAQDFARLEETLARLARSAETRNISVIVSGDRDLTSSRFFALAEHRLLCPTGLGRETTMMWPRTVPVRSHPGRCVYIGPDTPGDGIAAQMVSPHYEGSEPGQIGHPERTPMPAPDRGAPRASLAQSRAVPLPARAARPRDTLHTRSSAGDPPRAPVSGLPLGLRSPDGAPWVWSPGRLGVVLGPARSGKSTLLRAVGALIAERRPDLDVLHCSGGGDALPRTGRPGVAPYDERRPDLVLIDDATQLDPQARLHIEQWFDAGSAVVMTARTGPQLHTGLPLAHHARQSPDGVLLCPRSPRDGEFWNWRITATGETRPGRGLVLVDGRLRSVQAFSD
ncbi:hypothetical protein GCM10022377_00630 [Zhihengliuella alba]|uniref:FtsK domain-containing protein n=1 Tax=Zhihengliuella alba TaxID=547018 RepID=A0ABP7CPM5_9MICC